MSQKSSLPQAAKSVSQVLMSDTLTEAVTWILDGQARTDEEMKIASGKIERENHARWGSFLGPGWLLKPIERMRSGNVPEKVALSPYDDEIRVSALLERKQWDVETAYKEVCTELQEIEAAWARLEGFYNTIFKACEWERAHIEGIKVSNPRRDTFPHEPIPAEYFSRPVLHIMGKGYHGYGQLGPKRTGQQEFDSMFDTRLDVDRRETYIRARIQRGAVLALKEEFEIAVRRMESTSDVPTSSTTTRALAKAETDCRKQLEKMMRESPCKKLKTKAQILQEICPHLGKRASERVWSQAINNTGASAWSKAGAPRGRRTVRPHARPQKITTAEIGAAK